MSSPIILSKQMNEGELEALLELRRSTRVFSDKFVQLEELASVLQSCRVVNKQGYDERRTYPSGEARFPIDIYVFSFRINNLDNGAYKYNIKNSALEPLRVNKETLRVNQREIISPDIENPAATLMFTSVLSRLGSTWGLHAYRDMCIEAGHMGQNVHLRCVELGIGSCSVSGFSEETVRAILNLSSHELPFYAISLGWGKR